MSQKTDQIDRVRQHAATLVSALADLREDLRRHTTIGYADGAPNEITDEDFTGENAGLTAAQYGDAMFTVSEIFTLLDANGGGHLGNLYEFQAR